MLDHINRRSLLTAATASGSLLAAATGPGERASGCRRAQRRYPTARPGRNLRTSSRPQPRKLPRLPAGLPSVEQYLWAGQCLQNARADEVLKEHGLERFEAADLTMSSF